MSFLLTKQIVKQPAHCVYFLVANMKNLNRYKNVMNYYKNRDFLFCNKYTMPNRIKSSLGFFNLSHVRLHAVLQKGNTQFLWPILWARCN